MDIFRRIVSAARAAGSMFAAQVGQTNNSEIGSRATPENVQKYMSRVMWVDPELRQTILDIRDMDRRDGRVKRVHAKTAMDAVRGGLVMTIGEDNKRVSEEWDAFERRLQLSNAQKLKNDARLFVMQGNLPLQWVFDQEMNVVEAVSMPAETIYADVDPSGRFKDPAKAFVQLDVLTGTKLADFARYRMTLGRLDPDNFDDMGSMGRPFLDSIRKTWKQLTMTEDDLVLRRRVRAPLRLSHVLEGASVEALEDYRKRVENDRFEITTDYYQSKKGAVTAIQGDSTLGEIKDVAHLLDTFFAGGPLPRALLGYTDGMQRDILEDLKRTYYDEVDLIQDTLAWVYDEGFRIHLLFRGINPDSVDYELKFAQRRTETPQQTTDRCLKWQVLGIPKSMIWEELGLDPQYVQERRDAEGMMDDLYPGTSATLPGGGAPQPRVSVTPGNGRKGESATDVTVR